MDDQEPGRRKYPRIPSENAVLVNMLGDTLREQLTRTGNVSLGGCMFTSRHSYPVGSLLQLLITANHEVVEVVARVAYVQRRHSSIHDVGVEFVLMNDTAQTKLARLLRPSPE